MSPILLFAAHIALYTILPFSFTLLGGSLRLILLYVYAGAVLTVGGFLGVVYSIPLSDTVNLSGGTLAYGALMLTSVLLVIVERDASVLRTLVQIVVAVNAFKFLLFSIVTWSLSTSPVENPLNTSPDVFSTSARFIIIGGGLIIAELLVMFVILERIKTRLVNLPLLAVVGAVLFAAILFVDGLAFPLIALPVEPALANIAASAPGKLVMAVAYGTALAIFLLVFRSRVADYRATPIGLRNLLFAPRADLVHEIERQKELLESGEERYQSAIASARAVSERGERLAESANDAIVSIDAASRITSWNARAEELFGWKRDEALGRSVTELAIPARWRQAHRDAIARIVAAGDAVPITRHPTGLAGLHRAGHEIPIEISIAHELTDDGWVFTGFLRDQAGEAAAREELREELERRERVAGSLARIRPAGSPEAIASSLCGEIARTLDLELVAVDEIVGRGRAAAIVPLAIHFPGAQDVVAIEVGRPLPQHRSHQLLERARSGPWVSDLATEEPTPYIESLLSAGLRSAAYVPIGEPGEPTAVLIAGSANADVGRLAKHLSDLLEYAAIAAAYLGQALSDRQAIGQARQMIQTIIEAGTFRPVFQPIVDLEGGAVVGFEALTRFDDGRRPDLVFAEAISAGLGQELELATLGRVLTAAQGLAPETMLSLNVSPELILSGQLEAALPGRRDRIVLEVTEHVAIHDYPAVRAGVDSLGSVRLAVDDAGAGFASLRHIIELQPEFMKLDMSLVRGIEHDPARQGLVAGMVYFAVRTDRTLIAEGIETEAELGTLRSLGVELGQGYLLGRPGPLKTS